MSVSEIWEKFKDRCARASEFNSLSMAQREELARDVGLSECDFERLFAVRDRSPDEMERLMQALALDLEKMELANPGTVTRDMSVVCTVCAVVDRCRRELEAGSAARNYHEYCPNALTFEALLETEAQSQLVERNRDRQI
ncbi:MAG: DUF6455 family protein [Xanthobacteraceae bacterium]|nr:DUF6455 family protein [Xanthobacteraceae bacterium]